MTELSWKYPDSDIDPSQMDHSVLTDIYSKQWRRSDGVLCSIDETPLQNLYNLQVYIDKRIDSHSKLDMTYIRSRQLIEYYNEWAQIIAERIDVIGFRNL